MDPAGASRTASGKRAGVEGGMPAEMEGRYVADEPASYARPEDTGPAHDDVLATIPRYAMPNIASTLPFFMNEEQDFIHRTFQTGNYDQIRNLPHSIKHAQVQAARVTRMDLTRQFLMPSLAQPKLRSKEDNQQGLFAPFEYIPSRYSLADELSSKERVANETTRLTVGRGKEFRPPGPVGLNKQQDYDPSRGLPLLGHGYAAELHDVREMNRAQEEGKWVHGAPFRIPGADRPLEHACKVDTLAMMSSIKAWITRDWQGAAVTLFENEHDCWVVRVAADSVDSLEGLLTYMNVFFRCNELVNKFQLVKVPEFWHTQPGDGHVYYVVRPPWVRADRIATYYTLHPEERDWRTSIPVQAMARDRASQRQALLSEASDAVEQTQALHDAMRRMGLQVAGMDKFVQSVPSTAR